jgi:transposase
MDGELCPKIRVRQASTASGCGFVSHETQDINLRAISRTISQAALAQVRSTAFLCIVCQGEDTE